MDELESEEREPSRATWAIARLSSTNWLLGLQAISLVGTKISLVAIPWFVLTTTGSAALTGFVATAEMAPYVVAKALAGPVIDRVGGKRVSVACDAASAVFVGLIPRAPPGVDAELSAGAVACGPQRSGPRPR